MRLDQFIATTSALSRKDAKRAISSGRVRLDGHPCRAAATHINSSATVTLDNAPLALEGERYLMLHKPAGVVSATTDSDHPTALDLLPASIKRGLHIAGRLDADTTGLLLLTTDGQWSHRITSPRVQCPKTYRVTLSEMVPDLALQQLEQGIALRNDTRPTKPAMTRRISDCEIELTISEGRYHQVKRMMAAVGNHVTALHRLSIGVITLDTKLPPGAFRELTRAEVDSVS
ncbi:pseudouridine synthase [Marinobacter sp.]|uniref:pseudouridine synthase n=1 Tax=Marinobacter sp. TaxID=50741 RepID=UPI0034A37749